MNVSPLEKALAWFGERDEMGGFRTAGKELFAGWEPKRSCRAPHREDRQASFSVYRNARQEWRFKDFGTDEQGGLVGFAMLAGMDEKQASHWLMEKAGVISSGKTGVTATRRASPGDAGGKRAADSTEAGRVWSSAAEPEKLPGITRGAFEDWIEGVNYLGSSKDRIEALAIFRGWPVAWAQFLVEARAISMPLYHGRRTVAFLVDALEGERGSMTNRVVGFHCRLRLRRDGWKPGWRFVPNATEHGQSTPALPYILGGTSFESARLLVITGGQWDALTFAFAAGWLGEGCQWPAGVCVIGIRGDSSVNVFLRHYARFWPPSANCLLLPDADPSGIGWLIGPDSFAKQLSNRCRKVAIVTCGTHKDFNDLYRAGAITPEQIVSLLAERGMALEGEVAK